MEKNGDFYAGPFLPAKLARRTMTLSHRLFGIRSCNEVITGQRARPCLEYDIKRCIAPCVAEICTEERYGVAVASTQAAARRAQRRARRDAARPDGGGRRTASASRRRRSCATRCARCRRCAIASRRWRRPELGDRDVFGLKVGPSGGAIQVFAMRGGRVVERVELATDPGALAGGERGRAAGGAAASSTSCACRRRRSTCRWTIEDVDAMEEWLSARAGRRVRLLVPQRGDKRALVELATRNAELSYRTRFNEITAAHFEALETLRSVLGLPALPRRIECFDISTIQGSETVASMVVCEDGRMKRSEYRKFRIRGRFGLQAPGQIGPVPPDDRRPPTRTDFGSDDFAAMREVVQRRYRTVLEAGGPFPDLILIDGGKGQLSAAYEALEAIGLGNLVAVGIAKKEELLFTRDRPEPLVLAGERSGAAADPAHPRRGAPLRRDLPPQGALDARSALRAGRCAGHRRRAAAARC